MDLHLKNKIALITGGGRGIGMYTAKVLAQEGCDVAICGREAKYLEQTRDELRAMGVRAAMVRGDVCVAEDAKRIVEQCVAELGGVDILVNNVGNNFGGMLHEATEEDCVKTFEVNVFAAVRMIKLVAGPMKARGGGSIVNVASISGWHPQLAGTWQYGSSKAAQIFLTEVMALQLVHDRIRVNVVSPGSIIWPGNSWDEFRKQNPEQFAAYERDGFPMGRLGKPEEVADVIAFIASPRALWINGRNIPVDGVEQPTPVAAFRGW
ncbi:MAG: SDR family NAD(P)-dependent oxidoreductase [Planctomycetota bacterium]|nr:SDR family NAD(P)-dependent oxidoreductase [Planctomycetota bacterium]